MNHLVVATLISIPLAILWLGTADVLVLLGQDPAVSELAGAYMLAHLLVPAHRPHAQAAEEVAAAHREPEAG